MIFNKILFNRLYIKVVTRVVTSMQIILVSIDFIGICIRSPKPSMRVRFLLPLLL